MRSEEQVKELYEIRLREFKMMNNLDLFGDVTPRNLSDLRWILQLGEFSTSTEMKSGENEK